MNMDFSNISVEYVFYGLCGMAVLNLILLVLWLFNRVRYRRLFKSYDYFMRGKAAQNLEDTIVTMNEAIRDLKGEDKANKEAIRQLNRIQRSSYQKLGVVKYNAFSGMGGNLSFVCCVLDHTDSGFILNSVHSREGCYVYIKLVERGKTEVVLGGEEREALEQALGYRER